MKFNQNSIVKTVETVRRGKELIDIPVKIVTTMTKLFIYKNDKLVGSAGCKRAKDFDYEGLLAVARRTNSQLLEA